MCDCDTVNRKNLQTETDSPRYGTPWVDVDCSLEEIDLPGFAPQERLILRGITPQGDCEKYRVGHPFFSKECSVLCVLLCSL